MGRTTSTPTSCPAPRPANNDQAWPRLLAYARPGDSIVVVGIDRLGRNAAEVMATIRELGQRDIRLRSCGKASTPEPQPGGWWPECWPAWQNWNWNLAGNGDPPPAKPAVPEASTSAALKHWTLQGRPRPPDACRWRAGEDNRRDIRGVSGHGLQRLAEHAASADE